MVIGARLLAGSGDLDQIGSLRMVLIFIWRSYLSLV